MEPGKCWQYQKYFLHFIAKFEFVRKLCKKWQIIESFGCFPFAVCYGISFAANFVALSTHHRVLMVICETNRDILSIPAGAPIHTCTLAVGR